MWLRLAPILLVLLLAGCGGSGDDGAQPSAATPRATPSTEPEAEPRAEPRGGAGKDEDGDGGGADERPKGPVTSAETAIIRGWSDALRRGDVDRAVGFWAVPSIASNGGPPFKLQSAKDVRLFNAGLTCGAELESTARDADYVLAVFRLTERPGEGECGSGVGAKARTLFLLRDGKIVQWIRASDPRPPSQTPGGTTS